MPKSRIIKLILWIIFTIYIIILLKLAVFRNTHNIRKINIIPALMLINIFKEHGFIAFFYQAGGNVGWFLPLGFLLPLLVSRKLGFLKILIYSFLFSLFIETSQYILMCGYSELDDLILNTIGGGLGCCIRKIATAKAII